LIYGTSYCLIPLPVYVHHLILIYMKPVAFNELQNF